MHRGKRRTGLTNPEDSHYAGDGVHLQKPLRRLTLGLLLTAWGLAVAHVVFRMQCLHGCRCLILALVLSRSRPKLRGFLEECPSGQDLGFAWLYIRNF